jgi:hypothetical protein
VAAAAAVVVVEEDCAVVEVTAVANAFATWNYLST